MSLAYILIHYTYKHEYSIYIPFPQNSATFLFPSQDADLGSSHRGRGRRDHLGRRACLHLGLWVDLDLENRPKTRENHLTRKTSGKPSYFVMGNHHENSNINYVCYGKSLFSCGKSAISTGLFSITFCYRKIQHFYRENSL